MPNEQTLVVILTPRDYDKPALDFTLVYNTTWEFLPIQAEWLVTSITVMPVFYQWVHLAWQVSILCHRL